MLERIEFELSPQSHKRLSREVNPSGWSPAMFAALACFNLMRLPIWWFSGRHSFWANVSLASIVILVILYGMQWFTTNRHYRSIASSGSLMLANAGFTGTLNGTGVSIAWQEISGVRDLGDAIAIDRRRGSSVVLPKVSIADLPSLWACLEDRLVAKRDLFARPDRAPGSRTPRYNESAA